MEKKSSIFTKLGYLWIIIPIFIFFAGYCNLFWALIGCASIIIASYFALKNAPKLWFPSDKKEIFLLAGIALISLIWVYSSGIGAYVFQNMDHNVRNPIFELMVKDSWPVLNSDGSAILTYYIGFWFPSAIVGKIFNNVNIGYFCQLIWASVGVFLVFYFILCSLRKKNFIPVLIFIFFSGLDILGAILRDPDFINRYEITQHLEWWSGYYQFSSMTTQLYWVFNQALPAWLMAMLIYHHKDNKSIAFLYTCLFLFSTLPAIGIFPFIVYFVIRNIKNNWDKFNIKKCIINALKDVFSPQNIIGLILIFPITYLYLSGNVSGAHRAYYPPNILLLFVYLPFYLLEAGIYLLLIYKHNKNNILYHIIALTLFFYPFIYVGFGADFCMRATIPSLVFLYLLIVKALENVEFQRNKIIYFCLIITLIIGAVTPFDEISRTVYYTSKGVTKIKSDLGFNNFFGYVENNKFLKYFGKNKKLKAEAKN